MSTRTGSVGQSSGSSGGEMAGRELLGTSYRRWGEYLAAILIGNAIYF